MRKNDLIFGIGLSITCYLIAPDVFDKMETIAFQIGFAILGAYTSRFIWEALEDVKEYRERLSIRRKKEHRMKPVNFPHKKRYYVIPVTERYGND